MPLILSGNVASATADAGYTVANSCRFDDGSSDYLSRTPGSQGDLQISTFSYWVKRSSLGEQIILTTGDPDTAGSLFQIYFDSGDRIHIETDSPSLVTNRKFRDLSAWYHIVVAVDTTQATESNRVRIYVNGVEETSFATAEYPTQNASLNFNKTVAHHIGVLLVYDMAYYDGYMAEVVHVDGQQLAPTSFGEFDSSSPTIWKPIDVSGLTFGTNGFYLDFEDSAALGDDKSGNSNDFTVNNLTSVDQTTDTPTNNFCTLNPLNLTFTENIGAFLTEGNLKFQPASGDYCIAKATIAFPKAGKWYFEVLLGPSGEGGINGMLGIIRNPGTQSSTNAALGNYCNDYCYYSEGQAARTDIKKGSASETLIAASLTVWANDDTLSMAFNADDNEVKWYLNGALEHTLDLSSAPDGFYANDGDWLPAVSMYDGYASRSFNFGSPSHSISSGNADANGYGNFEYAPPSGYYALCTKNLAEFG